MHCVECRRGFSPDMVRSASRLKPLLQQLSLALVIVALAGCGSFSKKSGGKASPRQPAAGGTTAVPSKGDPQSRFSAAVQLMREKKLPDAEAAFVALANDFPQYSGPLTNLGIIYAKSNRRDQALMVLTKATLANNKNPVAWNWLGMTQRDAGDRVGAEQSYLKAVQAKPDYALAHLNLGILYDNYLGRPQDALVQYRQYQQYVGKEDLRITAWIAEIESRQTVSKPQSAPMPQATQPATGKPQPEQKGTFFPVRKP